MAVDPWPAELPALLLQEGYSEQEAENRLRSNTDKGPGKSRPRSSSNVRPVAAAMMMTDAEKALMRSFITETLLQGTLPFTFPAPDGSGDWLVRFAQDGLPAWSPSGDLRWRVAFRLEILP